MFWGRGQQKSSRQFDVADPPSRENARSQKDLRMGTFSDIGFEFFFVNFQNYPFKPVQADPVFEKGSKCHSAIVMGDLFWPLGLEPQTQLYTMLTA